MAERSREKQYALEWVEANRRRLSDFDLETWRYAEPAWREYKSARAYRELLRAEGFSVEEGSGEMPTAFVATYGDGGPVLGAYAEYDAVPGNSQQPGLSGFWTAHAPHPYRRLDEERGARHETNYSCLLWSDAAFLCSNGDAQADQPGHQCGQDVPEAQCKNEHHHQGSDRHKSYPPRD